MAEIPAHLFLPSCNTTSIVKTYADNPVFSHTFAISVVPNPPW